MDGIGEHSDAIDDVMDRVSIDVISDGTDRG
jgi:hypothetical protein